jgi:hypothetical protein
MSGPVCGILANATTLGNGSCYFFVVPASWVSPVQQPNLWDDCVDAGGNAVFDNARRAELSSGQTRVVKTSPKQSPSDPTPREKPAGQSRISTRTLALAIQRMARSNPARRLLASQTHRNERAGRLPRGLADDATSGKLVDSNRARWMLRVLGIGIALSLAMLIGPPQHAQAGGPRDVAGTVYFESASKGTRWQRAAAAQQNTLGTS